MDEVEHQLIRVRVRPFLKPIYLLRHVGDPVAGYPGADRVHCAGSRLLAAHSPRRLLLEAGLSELVPLPMLLLNLRHGRRWISRPPRRWSRVARGTLREADDLIFDVAASLGASDVARACSEPTAFHATYRYLWGDEAQLPPASVRLAEWDSQVSWFVRHLSVLDR